MHDESPALNEGEEGRGGGKRGRKEGKEEKKKGEGEEERHQAVRVQVLESCRG